MSRKPSTTQQHLFLIPAMDLVCYFGCPSTDPMMSVHMLAPRAAWKSNSRSTSALSYSDRTFSAKATNSCDISMDTAVMFHAEK